MVGRHNMHSLHHTREMEDMRQTFQRNLSHDSAPSCKSSPREGADRLNRAHSSEYSTRPAKQSPRIHYHPQDPPRYFPDQPRQESPKSSVETYASTIHSEEDLQELPEYEVPDYTAVTHEPTAIPASPADFSELFPSRRRLLIRHDDSTLDGNMNLRLDTLVDVGKARRSEMTLFHLRMHDLRTRAFSLRRYCRDSGREVCHSSRKEQKSGAEKAKRPGFQRSLSNALSSMRPRSSDQKNAGSSSSLQRNDSGYGSLKSIETDDDRPRSEGDAPQLQPTPLTNTVRLEFSNYAQVEVKPVGSKASKRYEFEYWAEKYSWRRIVRKDSQRKDVSFHLTKGSNHEAILAQIVPEPMTPPEVEEEERKGGWIPPCSMWIADEGIARAQKDLSDVVVAAGLIALVDDSIQSRFLRKDARSNRRPQLPLGVAYVGPKRLFNEIFRRDAQQSRSASNSRPPTRDAGATSARPSLSLFRHQSDR